MSEKDGGRYRYGERIIDGVLQYESPSGIDTADTRNDGGCLRKWFYRYVMHIREPSTAAQEIGTKGHGEIEHYLKTGEDVLGPIARRGMHMIPEPGPDLLIEWALASPPPGTDMRPRCTTCKTPPATESAVGCAMCGGEVAPPLVDPKRSHLWIDGIPIIGYLDLAHGRGTNKGTTEIVESRDPDGTIEVLDWKFSRDPAKWGKTEEQIARATPMLSYGRGLATACANTPTHVRLSHGYISTEKRDAFKRSKRLPLAIIDERLEAVVPVMRAIKDAARETDASRVPGNTRACGAFKGCIHLPYCSAGQRGSLEAIFGPPPSAPLPPVAVVRGEAAMSTNVLDLMKNLPGMVAAQAPATAAPVVASVNLPAGVGVALGIPAAPAVVAAPPPPVVPPGFVEAWADIIDAGYGAPTLTGEAAAAFRALAKPSDPPGLMYPGSGQLNTAECKTLDNVFAVAASLKPHAEAARAQRAASQPQYAAERAAAPAASTPPPAPYANASLPSVLPPDAPASNPAIASVPVQPTAAELASGTFPQGAIAAMQVQQAAAQAAMPTPAVVADPMPVAVPAVDATKPKGTRKKKTADIEASGRKGGETSHDTNGVTIYIDAVPSVAYESLHPWIDGLVAKLLSSPHANGATDLRLIQGETLGFGKWKAVLEALAREAFDLGTLPEGHYTVNAGDIADVVVAGLRGKVDNVVRGLR